MMHLAVRHIQKKIDWKAFIKPKKKLSLESFEI